MIGGISFSATSITSGLDVDKPVSPKPGNQYLATDTKILYVCYDAGIWVNASPPLPKIAIVETTNNPSKDSKQSFYRGVVPPELANRPNDCSQTPTYSFIVQTDMTAFMNFGTRGSDGGGTTYHRMCINGVSVYYYTSNTSTFVYNSVIHEFKKGDVVTVIATTASTWSGAGASLSIKWDPILTVDGVKFTPVSIDESAFLLLV